MAYGPNTNTGSKLLRSVISRYKDLTSEDKKNGAPDRFKDLLESCDSYKNARKNSRYNQYDLLDVARDDYMFMLKVVIPQLYKENNMPFHGNDIRENLMRYLDLKTKYDDHKNSIELFDGNKEGAKQQTRVMVDMLSSLDLLYDFISEGPSNRDITGFARKFSLILSFINNSKIVSWYARDLKDIVMLYCVYHHYTGKEYLNILEEIKKKIESMQSLVSIEDTPTIRKDILNMIGNCCEKGDFCEAICKYIGGIGIDNFNSRRYKEATLLAIGELFNIIESKMSEDDKNIYKRMKEKIENNATLFPEQIYLSESDRKRLVQWAFGETDEAEIKRLYKDVETLCKNDNSSDISFLRYMIILTIRNDLVEEDKRKRKENFSTELCDKVNDHLQSIGLFQLYKSNDTFFRRFNNVFLKHFKGDLAVLER